MKTTTSKPFTVILPGSERFFATEAQAVAFAVDRIGSACGPRGWLVVRGQAVAS